VLAIEGCPSGTLGYLFGEIGRGIPFSTALRAAMALGYTEPDPRDDLSGMDVARKALILAQLLGYEGTLDEVAVESLVPEELRTVTIAEFLARIEELDPVWRRRVAEVRASGRMLLYRATVTAEGARVGLVAVGALSSFAALTGTDNQFAITTTRYRANPIVISGPGAGVAVTAAGGLGLLVGGARPHELLHLVYAVVALAALPISTSVSARWEPRRRAIATVIGALIGLAVIVRLFGTG